MQFPKANSFSQDSVLSKIMGPNPLKLCEEMILTANEIVGNKAVSPSSVVLDLGSGTGITTALLAREFGCAAYAVDLWSNPTENMRFFETLGLTNRQIVPIKTDASEGLPFAEGFFDAVVSIDSYNYFGRSAEYLDAKLLPYVKRGGIVALCFPAGSVIATLTRRHACLSHGRLISLIIFTIFPGGKLFLSNRKMPTS